MASLLSISLTFMLSCSIWSSAAESYRKELRTKTEVNQQPIIQLGNSTRSTRINPSQVTQLSWRPRVFLYRDFLSDEECDHLISLAHGKIEKSFVKENDTGKIVNGNLLTNSVTPLDIEQDDIVARIEDRISAWTFIPKDNSKRVQILHYVHEDTKQHLDYNGDKAQLGSSEPLMATVVLYLSNVTKGGEILFQESEFKNTQPKDYTWSDCAKTGYAVKPIKGNAVLFFNIHPNTSPDESSSHARCPVVEGEKWCAIKFFHVRAILGKKASLESENGGCTDEDDNCRSWAALGECQRNPVYMIGTPDYYGSCRRSCNMC